MTVDLAFSDEQEELRRSVRRFCDERSPVSEVRRLMETDDGYDPTVWKLMADELALQALHIPEAYGGQGFGFRELCIVLEETGAALLCAPYFSTVCLAANAILQAGSEDSKRELLPPIAAGETVAALALVEDAGVWDASGISLEAMPDGDAHRLSGTKMFVVDGHLADLLVVAARLPQTSGEQGIGLFTVVADATVERTLLQTLDTTRKLARVTFNESEARALGRAGDDWPALERTLDLAAVCLSNESLGGAQRAFDMSVEYAKTRMQFGRPIASFQAIKHRCADLLLDLESARSAALYAAAAVEQSPADVGIAAPLAKAYCTGAYFRIAAENIQIHGGIGFTWEHDAHLYYKRGKSSELLLGDPVYHRELIAQRLAV